MYLLKCSYITSYYFRCIFTVMCTFTDNLRATPPPDEAITETSSNNKPERPKPPTSLPTVGTRQAIPPTHIPIVSPDRYRELQNKIIWIYCIYVWYNLNTVFDNAVPRQTERRTQITTLCPHKHLSQRAPCCRSSADQRRLTKKRPTRSILSTVSG